MGKNRLLSAAEGEKTSEFCADGKKEKKKVLFSGGKKGEREQLWAQLGRG